MMLGFVLVSLGIILLPGPNVLVIVATGLSQGVARALQTVAGTSLVMLVQLIIAASATTWLVTVLAEGLAWLKWVGIAYLIYLGISHASKVWRSADSVVAGTASFRRGFWVSLTNPKTIMFFSAFLPQFVTAGEPYQEQIMVLSGLFWCLATLIDSGYAVLSGRLSALPLHAEWQKFRHGVSAIVYLSAAAALAMVRNGR